MDRAALFEAIDRAIVNVAEREFRRLSTKVVPGELADGVHQALDALGKLRDGIPPNYRNRWIPLLYLTWYQPRQIYYAHCLIRYVNRSGRGTLLLDANKQSLHVVDFGCGALAMQFAVAWAAAEALEAGAGPRRIRIDSYDPAGPMVSVGQALWREFEQEISNDSRLSLVSQAVSSIEPRGFASESGLALGQRSGGEERWLSALHTVYKNNVTKVTSSLARIAGAFQPDIGLMSCGPDDLPKGLLTQASPFDKRAYRSFSVASSADPDARLPKVTEWRQVLNSAMTRQHTFLDSEVPWVRRASGMIYSRQA